MIRARDGKAEATSPQADRLPLLAFLTDEASEAALRTGLAELGGTVQVRRGDIRHAVRALERETTPQVLVVDVTGVEDALGALEKLAGVCTPDVHVFVVGERADIGFYRSVVHELGADEYIFKPLTRDNIATLLGARIAQETGATENVPGRGGRIVTVCGMRGGVGATTVAVNLAALVAESTKGHVALLDLHLRGGSAALMLGGKPGSGLRVALEEPERADALLLDRVAIPVSERLRVIAAEEPFDIDPAPTPEGVRNVLDLLRARFNVIVVDLPMPPGAAERMALSMARHRIFVLGPDLASVRDAEAARKLVSGLGVATPPILALNREGWRGGLRTALIEEGLGVGFDLRIPDLPAQIPAAANLGKLALNESQAFRRALQPVAAELFGGKRAVEPKRLLGFWRRQARGTVAS